MDLINFNIEEMFKDISHSLVTKQLPDLEPKLSREYILSNKDYSKYIIDGYEDLSIYIANVLLSGRGGFIVNYAAKYGVNRYVVGFSNKEELLHYARYTVENAAESLKRVKERIDELKKIEDNMSSEEILKKNLEYFENYKKILENIYDFEAKKPYCEKVEQLETVQTEFNNFLELYALISPIHNELQRISINK